MKADGLHSNPAPHPGLPVNASPPHHHLNGHFHNKSTVEVILFQPCITVFLTDVGRCVAFTFSMRSGHALVQ